MNFWNALSPLFKAIFCVLLSALSFTAMAVFLRLSGELTVAEKAIFRNGITALISDYIVWKNSQLFFGHKEK